MRLLHKPNVHKSTRMQHWDIRMTLRGRDKSNQSHSTRAGFQLKCRLQCCTWVVGHGPGAHPHVPFAHVLFAIKAMKQDLSRCCYNLRQAQQNDSSLYAVASVHTQPLLCLCVNTRFTRRRVFYLLSRQVEVIQLFQESCHRTEHVQSMSGLAEKCTHCPAFRYTLVPPQLNAAA